MKLLSSSHWKEKNAKHNVVRSVEFRRLKLKDVVKHFLPDASVEIQFTNLHYSK